jgi:hypothetical protein
MNQDNGGIIGKINTSTTTVASGVWTLQDQFEAQASSIWPLAFPQITIANSCRFNSGSTDYLSKTFGTATNTKKFTWSFWVKRTKLGAGQYFFENVGSHTYQGSILFDSNDRLQMYEDGLGSGSGMYLITNRKFRDVSAWYNIVIAVDSTQSTSSNRAKFFVNGTQETSFQTSTYPSQDHALPYISGSGDPCNIGKYDNTNSNFDGYLAETVFIDGQALDPTSFGVFNTVSNIWEPRGYAGTYGTNGFRLDFADSSALGNDVSGNDNDFTVNNLTSIDQSTDTCSNNFATWNPLDNFYGEGTTSEGNTRYTTGSTNQAPIPATIGVSSGKWYWEVKFVSDTGGYAMIGIASSQTTANNELGHNSTDYAYVSGTGQYRNNDGYTSYGNTYTTGDIIGVALDLDNNKLYFSKNGTFQNSGDPTSGSTGTGAISITASASTSLGNYFPALSDFGSNTVVFDGNFGSPPYTISSGNADANGFGNFEYSVPSGYFSLCTKNLAEFG